MLTPREQKYWEKIKDRPKLAMLIERLGLEPVESEAFKKNKKIEERVQLLIDQIPLEPRAKRRVIQERRNPFENPDLSYLKPGEVPF